MTEAQQMFVREAIARARELSLSDAVIFLRGMIESISDTEVKGKLNIVYIGLFESDRQLELIQMGQLKLNLPVDGDGHAKGGQL